jgi:hypothetical protein
VRSIGLGRVTFTGLALFARAKDIFFNGQRARAPDFAGHRIRVRPVRLLLNFSFLSLPVKGFAGNRSQSFAEIHQRPQKNETAHLSIRDYVDAGVFLKSECVLYAAILRLLEPPNRKLATSLALRASIRYPGRSREPITSAR